jgi:hypothetical protein
MVSISSEHRRTSKFAGLSRIFTDFLYSRRLTELEQALKVEREARLLIEGQLVAQRGEIDYLRETATAAAANERKVYQMQVNVNMQTKYGITPFPEAPAIPDSLTSQVQKPIQTDYVAARNLQAAAWSAFRQEAQSRFNPSN